MIKPMDTCNLKPVRDGIWRRDFAGLMELYECNYIQLRKLVPDMDGVPEVAVSRVYGALDLHMRVLERCKYTTTLHLSYHFDDEHGIFLAPDIRVRIYHDAQVGEVMSCGHLRSVRETGYNKNSNDVPLNRRWHINRFLYKWLGYCLMQGHSFAPGCTTEPAADSEVTATDSLLITES